MVELTSMEKVSLLAILDEGKGTNQELLAVMMSIEAPLLEQIDGEVRRTIVLYSLAVVNSWRGQPELVNCDKETELRAMYSMAWVQGYMAALAWGKPLVRKER